jgi:hypothetical protein
MRQTLVFLLLSSLLFSSGCATIFTGTKQTIQLDSEPSGALVQVDGIDRGKTPLALTLKKGNDGQVIRLDKEGYETRTFQAQTTFNGVAVLNFFNLLFWGIDAATGALWKYDPGSYLIRMEQASPDPDPRP